MYEFVDMLIRYAPAISKRGSELVFVFDDTPEAMSAYELIMSAIKVRSAWKAKTSSVAVSPEEAEFLKVRELRMFADVFPSNFRLCDDKPK
jgi:hypothetical protein